MYNYAQLDPPVAINVAGHHRLQGTVTGVLIVKATDHQNFKHAVKLPLTVVPHLARHLFSAGRAVAKGVPIGFAAGSHVDMGKSKVPIRTDELCPTLYHIDLSLKT